MIIDSTLVILIDLSVCNFNKTRQRSIKSRFQFSVMSRFMLPFDQRSIAHKNLLIIVEINTKCCLWHVYSLEYLLPTTKSYSMISIFRESVGNHLFYRYAYYCGKKLCILYYYITACRKIYINATYERQKYATHLQ